MKNSKPLNLKLISLLMVSLLAVYLVWDYYVIKTGQIDTPINYWSNVWAISLHWTASIICIYGAYKLKGHLAAKAYGAWAIATLLWGAGLMVWSYYNLVLQVEAPYPSLADYFFVSFLPIMAVGIWIMQKVYQKERHQPLLASIPIMIVSILAVVVVFNKPELSSDLPVAERTISLALSLGDAFLLSMAMAAAQGAAFAKANKSIYVIIFALLVLLSADFLFLYTSANETYFNGSISDVLYTSFPAIFAIGVAGSINYLYKESKTTKLQDKVALTTSA